MLLNPLVGLQMRLLSGSLRICLLGLLLFFLALSLLPLLLHLLLLVEQLLHILVVVLGLQLVFLLGLLLVLSPGQLVREVNIALDLHTGVVHLLLLVLLLVEQVLKLLFQQQSLVLWEVVGVALVLLIEVLEDLIFLVGVQILEGDVLLAV